MILTVEVIEQAAINLLNDLESLGLIHVKPSVSQGEKTSDEDNPPYQWLRGCCESRPGGSVEDFLSRSREEKKHELAIEKRQEEERARLASAKLSS